MNADPDPVVTRIRIYANPKHLLSQQVLHFIFLKFFIYAHTHEKLHGNTIHSELFKITENKNIDNKNLKYLSLLCFVHRVFSWSGTWTGRVRPRMGCRPGSGTAGRRGGRGGRPPAGTPGPAGPHPGRTFAASLHIRVNMELGLQSLFGLLCTAVLIGWDPATPPSPSLWAHTYTRALFVSQYRRHLFVRNPLG